MMPRAAARSRLIAGATKKRGWRSMDRGAGDAMSDGSLHERHMGLVDRLVGRGDIRSPRIEAAFRAVPRHLFLPGVDPERVYQDEAIPTRVRDGEPISSSSQPAAMAVMLEQLDIQPGDRVLEVGAGTGYNAALLAHLAGPSGRVTAIDLDDEIVAEARDHLAAAGASEVRLVAGDGVHGVPEDAPYDRIMLTVGAWDVAPAWREQLGTGGRLLLPLWLRGAQKTVAFMPATDEHGREHLASISVSSCSFMRLRGALAGPEGYLPLGPTSEFSLGLEDRSAVDPAWAYRQLSGPFQELSVPAATSTIEVWTSLTLWLALRHPGFCTLHAEGVLASAPRLSGQGSSRFTCGLIDEHGFALLAHPEPGETVDNLQPLAIRVYGPTETLARELAASIAAWDATGRPGDDRLRLRVDPLPTDRAPDAGETTLDKRWTRVAVRWEPRSADA
jgi:protein-L-isoaspartate(D-aspartate) O-methyltransferase